MADVPISGLPPGAPPSGTEELPAVQGGVTVRITASGIAALATGGPPSGPAGGVLSGTYPNPSLTTTGITPGLYGDAANAVVIVFDTDGRAISATTVPISPTSAVGGVLTGSLPNPGLANTTVVAATYGSTTTFPQIVVGPDGRITSGGDILLDAPNVEYTATTPADWAASSPPNNVATALDRIASALSAAGFPP